MDRSDVKKNNVLVCLIIGICFLWNGSSYMTWLHRILDIIDTNSISTNADMIFEVYSYIMQVIGTLIAIIYVRSTNDDYTGRRAKFIAAVILQMISVFPSVLSSSYTVCLISGYIMNILNGIIIAFYLFLLVELVPSHHRGIIFGLGYSIGSIGSWMLSLIGGNNFLRNISVLVVYLFLMVIIIGLILITDDNKTDTNCTYDKQNNNNNLIVFAGIMIFMLCTTKGIGFYFPMADVTSGSVSLELSRAFYAIGLIIAGILGDYKRTYSGIACIAALMFPFVLLAMTSSPEYSFYTWILSYVFIAFYNVFRVLIFADLADRTPYGLYLAPMGLMCGRLGDSVGSAIGITFIDNAIGLIVLGAILFAITIVMAFYVFQKIYLTLAPVTDEVTLTYEEKISAYATYHDLSSREKEVLPLILNGKSNGEISGELFVSENTVKFHVRNILKKTGCSNRQELFKNFGNYQL